eukprot:Gregarina_sp_Poly_1__2945@NODE_1823_length_3269_cov_238_074329_g1183_i0_p2_GENE_NODE_1823_length_3269_cov_238_074329_g1183_i0NODE_1823_length_3269_cov_238_074329_g1183_i0_p2_ORF_typecomplete_len293_score35_31Arginase/PF00491_21/6_1e39B12binding/PF02310_19/1_5B12binding/PF02310_19/3_3e02_NODE_1823_length_3269_cov_238_074329_g1183_i022763154
MSNPSCELRLIYPQWQGGVISHWIPDIPAEDSSRGYFLGAQLLSFLSPEAKSSQVTAVVPISLDINDRAIEKGITSYGSILRQTEAAIQIVQERAPERIITLGGECSVSVVPFTYLASKYSDVAIVWIDAHPDINLPYDPYPGYHAMALTACLGMGDETITGLLPGKFEPSKALIVGLRSWEDGMKERQQKLGIKGLSPADVAENSLAVMDWLKSTRASKVVIHLDLDVLDPAEMIAGVVGVPDGMKVSHVMRVINDIAVDYDVVGLTVAEPMPRIAIKLQNMLRDLPLLRH